ncbi:MAG: FAD-dependent oxidoreductase, partial [Opitutaceae bacterium]|nr:FAD-dependent oxidoreductase [Opitutaceae bacterium]
KDEFVETGGWPGQLYIREARRMVGALVMTQHHCQGREIVADAIGMAAYTMDSHNTRRHVDATGHVRNEGDVQVKGFPPYPVGYRALVPREGECENLIVPVCMSASHIAYGSIRMEPIFMIFGQSAATAAALAIDDRVSVQKVNYNKLRQRLLKDGQVLPKSNDMIPDRTVLSSDRHMQAALKNSDVSWNGTYGGPKPVLSEPALEILKIIMDERKHGKNNTMNKIKLLLNDPDRFVVAHVILTESLIGERIYVSGTHWNGLSVQLLNNGKVEIDPAQRVVLQEKWLNKISMP